MALGRAQRACRVPDAAEGHRDGVRLPRRVKDDAQSGRGGPISGIRIGPASPMNATISYPPALRSGNG